MIKLTLCQGATFWVCPEAIAAVRTNGVGQTSLQVANSFYLVSESPEAVVNAMLAAGLPPPKDPGEIRPKDYK